MALLTCSFKSLSITLPSGWLAIDVHLGIDTHPQRNRNTISINEEIITRNYALQG